MPYFFRLKDAINEDGTPNAKWFKHFLLAAGEFCNHCESRDIIILGVSKPKNIKHVFTKLPNPITGIIERIPFEFMTDDAVSIHNIHNKPLMRVNIEEIEYIEDTIRNKWHELQTTIEHQLKRTAFYKIFKNAPRAPEHVYLHITCKENKRSILTHGLYSESQLTPDMFNGNRGGNRKSTTRKKKKTTQSKNKNKTKYLRRS
jgi:hypothetical protein